MTVIKIALGVLLALTVFVVGCVAILGAGFEEADREQRAKGITLKQFRAVKQGTPQRTVERRLGQPEDAQEFEDQIPELQEGPNQSSCIYYPEKGKPLFEGRSFQLCFTNGRLDSKNAY